MKATILLLIGMMLVGTLQAQTEVAPKDNFFWTHRKERHWQVWTGGGPVISTRSGFWWEKFTYAKTYKRPIGSFYFQNPTGGKSLAEFVGPYGLAGQLNGIYRANRWFGIQAGLEYSALLSYSKFYTYEASYRSHLDVTNSYSGYYPYIYDTGPPTGSYTKLNLLHGHAGQLQFILQVPGGRLGIRTGLRVQSYYVRGFENYGIQQFTTASSLFFGLTPKLRVEVQRTYLIEDYGGHLGKLPEVLGENRSRGMLLFSLQYRLTGDPH